MKENLAFKAGIVDYRYECGIIENNNKHRICFSNYLNIIQAAYKGIVEVTKHYNDTITYLYDYELEEYVEKYDTNDYN